MNSKDDLKKAKEKGLVSKNLVKSMQDQPISIYKNLQDFKLNSSGLGDGFNAFDLESMSIERYN